MVHRPSAIKRSTQEIRNCVCVQREPCVESRVGPEACDRCGACCHVLRCLAARHAKRGVLGTVPYRAVAVERGVTKMPGRRRRPALDSIGIPFRSGAPRINQAHPES
jgi:hypothetical protein